MPQRLRLRTLRQIFSRTLVNLLRCFQCQQTARSTGIRAALSERKKNTAPLRTKLAKCENEAHLPTFALFRRRHPAFF